jgi:predicted nucleic acid-binding protein
MILLTPTGLRVKARLVGEELHAPHALDVEVVHVLRRVLRSTQYEARYRDHQALDDFSALPIVRHGHEVLVPRMWALRHNLSAYDAAYVALAEWLDVPLITADARIANAPVHGATIELP